MANSLKQDTAKVQASDASSGLVLSNLSAQTKLPFACGLCGQLFAQLLMLEKHRCKRQYAGSSGQRFLLPKPFPEPSAAVMTTAEQLAANTSGYLCGECGENFVDETAVYSHMLSKHMSKFCDRTHINRVSSSLWQMLAHFCCCDISAFINMFR